MHYHLLGYKFMYRVNVVLIQINSFGHEIFFFYVLYKMPLDITSCNGLVKKTRKITDGYDFAVFNVHV